MRRNESSDGAREKNTFLNPELEKASKTQNWTQVSIENTVSTGPPTHLTFNMCI